MYVAGVVHIYLCAGCTYIDATSTSVCKESDVLGLPPPFPSLNPQPSTRYPEQLCTLHLKPNPQILDSQPSALNPKP